MGWSISIPNSLCFSSSLYYVSIWHIGVSMYLPLFTPNLTLVQAVIFWYCWINKAKQPCQFLNLSLLIFFFLHILVFISFSLNTSPNLHILSSISTKSDLVSAFSIGHNPANGDALSTISISISRPISLLSPFSFRFSLNPLACLTSGPSSDCRIVSRGFGFAKMMNSYVSYPLLLSGPLFLSLLAHVSESPDTILSLHQSNTCLRNHSLAFWIRWNVLSGNSPSPSLYYFSILLSLFVTLNSFYWMCSFFFVVRRCFVSLDS